MFLTISIPHQMRAFATKYDDRDDFIANVFQTTDCLMREEQTRQSLSDMFGEELDSYLNDNPSLAKLLEQYGSVVEVKYGCNDDIQYFAPDYAETGEKAPSEFDIAVEAAGDDLHSFSCFDSLEEAVDYVKSYSGHQSGSVYSEVMYWKRRQDRIDGILEEDDDDE